MLKHRILIEEEVIRRQVDELAARIAADLSDSPLILLGLLTGSFVFVADLARALSRRQVELKVDFLSVSHYGGSTDPERTVHIEQDTSVELAGQSVLMVDDILDSGRSMAFAVEHVRRRRPGWLRTCAFLDKPSQRLTQIDADYVGFLVEDSWLIGYGLDLDGQGRALPYIAAVET